MNKLYRLPLRTRAKNLSSGVRRRRNSSKILVTSLLAVGALAVLVVIGLAALFTFKHQTAKPKAITATARKLGCLIYRLIKNGQAYQAPDLHVYELKYKDQILNSLRKRANSFGFDLVEVPKAA